MWCFNLCRGVLQDWMFSEVVYQVVLISERRCLVRRFQVEWIGLLSILIFVGFVIGVAWSSGVVAF